MLGESGDEEEQDAIVNQVLDEIGIEISGKVCREQIFHKGGGGGWENLVGGQGI